MRVKLIRRKFFSSFSDKNFRSIGQAIAEKIEFLFQKRPENQNFFSFLHFKTQHTRVYTRYCSHGQDRSKVMHWGVKAAWRAEATHN